MGVKFIHTADWQIGKPFARVEDDEKRTLIRQERIAAIGRIGEIASQHEAEFIVVAGDLFDTPTVGQATVSAACAAIGKLGIPVFVIPGNHDHGGPGCLWDQTFFKREHASLAPNLHLLLEPGVKKWDRALLYPCPLLRRHESADPTAWLREVEEPDGDGELARIVIAHGSTQEFTNVADEEEGGAGSPNLIDLDRLPVGFFDYVALGDWHGMKQVGTNAWYSGTPEPDRFAKGESNLPGHVLAVTVGRGETPKVVPVESKRLGWHQVDFEFTGDDDLAAFGGRLAEVLGGRAGEDLLHLTLRGSLGLEATTELEELLDAWRARLLRMKLYNFTVVAPSDEEIEMLTRRADDPLIARVATRLVAGGEDEELTRTALRQLHALANAEL